MPTLQTARAKRRPGRGLGLARAKRKPGRGLGLGPGHPAALPLHVIFVHTNINVNLQASPLPPTLFSDVVRI